MSDSEELPRKTSKGFCSDSLSLPDDAEEDEAEEEAFLLATASLRSGRWQLSHNASPLCAQNSHRATTRDRATIQNGHRATTPAHFVHKIRTAPQQETTLRSKMATAPKRQPTLFTNSHRATTGDHVTIQNSHRATTPAHFVHKFRTAPQREITFRSEIVTAPHSRTQS